MKDILKRILSALLKSINPICAKSKFLTRIRFFFFPEGFIDEQYATLCGIAEYEKREKAKSNLYELRRNIHRLEKGLTYANRKAVFAKDYIKETVISLKRLSNVPSFDEKDYGWAYTVLKNYFDVVDNSDKVISSSKEVFNSIEPYYKPEFELKTKTKNTTISYEEFLNFIEARRSVRLYQEINVPREIIDKAINIAKQAPSACNRQPFEFRIFDDKKLIKSIASIPKGTSGFVDNFPCFILVVGKLDAYFHTRDRHAIYIDSSLAIMSFLFALETLELGGCVFNWPNHRNVDKKIRKIINLEKYETIVTSLSIGYPKEDNLVPTSVKKGLNHLRNYNKV